MQPPCRTPLAAPLAARLAAARSVQVEAFIGQSVMVGFLVIGVVIFLVGTITLVGIFRKSPKTMVLMWVMWFLLLLVQVAMAVLLCWWVYVIEDVPNETLATLQGSDDGRYEGQLGAKTLSNVEGFVCGLHVCPG